MSYNPITFILNLNKLIEPNYVDWNKFGYSAHVKGAKMGNSKFTPTVLNEYSLQEKKNAHQKWQKVNKKAMCIILGS